MNTTAAGLRGRTWGDVAFRAVLTLGALAVPVLLGFLVAMLTKHGASQVIFDKDRGLEICMLTPDLWTQAKWGRGSLAAPDEKDFECRNSPYDAEC